MSRFDRIVTGKEKHRIVERLHGASKKGDGINAGSRFFEHVAKYGLNAYQGFDKGYRLSELLGEKGRPAQRFINTPLGIVVPHPTMLEVEGDDGRLKGLEIGLRVNAPITGILLPLSNDLVLRDDALSPWAANADSGMHLMSKVLSLRDAMELDPENENLQTPLSENYVAIQFVPYDEVPVDLRIVG